jgi:phage terminase large subunit
VYGLGILGEVEGKIYTDWQIIDDIPHEARLERRGLDFGYTNDPTALIDLYKYNQGFIIDEQLYQKGMSNKAIADFILILPEPQTLVMADSAEPKSIDEIKSYGINVLPVRKGKDSVRQGINYVQAQRISMTKRSVNVIREYRNYLWMTDKEGKILNEPEHQFKHSMDAIVYAFDSYQDLAPIIEKQNWKFNRNQWKFKQNSNK